MQWGLLPSWTKEPTKAQRPINARCETVAASGLFRGALKARRCIVPADAFYEWKAGEGGKQPYAIARQDGQPMAFAGLWEGFRRPECMVTRSYTIITTTPNAEIVDLHNRMPVIPEPDDWPCWLGEVEADAATMLHPSPDGTLRTWPVSKRVGSPRNNDAELIKPISEDLNM